MPWSMRNINCINALCAFFLLSQPTAGTVIVPGDVAADETIARRVCEPAAPDVSQSSIIDGVCNQTLANGFPTCSDQMTAQMQHSAANTCGQYSSLLTDCLMANKNDHTSCSDSLLGYRDCQVDTMQAYAYCACYYTLPASIADCANEQLQPQLRATATVPTTNTPVTAIPTDSVIPAGTVPANEGPGTPPILAASQEATSASPPTFSSDPRIPNALSWTPNAAPSTATTVVSTYTTTFTETTTATITSSYAVISTCSDGDATSSAPTPIVAASAGPETLAPDPAIMPAAQSTGSGIPEATGNYETSTFISPTPSPSVSPPEPSQPQNTAARTAEGQIASLQPSISTSTSTSTPVFPPTLISTSASTSAPILPSLPLPAPALVTSIVPSAATAAARNRSAVCVVCRRGRRSRVF